MVYLVLKKKPYTLKNSIAILLRSIVSPYYKQIQGVLYFLFFIFFGIQPGIRQALETHYQIMLSILLQKSSFLIFTLFFILYVLKCILFFANHTSRNEYAYLQVLNSISARKRFWLFFKIVFLLLLPVFIYTLGIFITAINSHHYLQIIYPLSLFVFLWALTTFGFVFINSNPYFLKTKYAFTFRWQPSTLWWFLLKQVFAHQFWTLVIIKTISFLCLYLFTMTDASVFENRILWLLFTLCLVAHSMLIYKNFYFLENKFLFYRALPIKRISILISLLIGYTLLLLPEFWALRGMAILHHNTYEYVCMLLAAPAILTLLHCLLYTEDMNLENYLSLVFLVWIVFFFFGFSTTKWLIPVLGFISCCLVFFTSFHRFEKKAEIEKLE